MKFFTLAAIAATLIAEVSAGTFLQSIWVDGVDQGAGAIRKPSTSASVKNLTSTDIRCNGGNLPVENYVLVPAGGRLTAQWCTYGPSPVHQLASSAFRPRFPGRCHHRSLTRWTNQCVKHSYISDPSLIGPKPHTSDLQARTVSVLLGSRSSTRAISMVPGPPKSCGTTKER